MADSYVIRQGTERNTNPMFMEIMAKDLTELAKYASKCTPGSLGYLEDATVYRLGTQGTWVKVGDDFTSRFAEKADKATTYTKTESDAAISAAIAPKADQATTYTKTEVDAAIAPVTSQLADITTDFLTLANMISIGSFEDGLTGWTAYGTPAGTAEAATDIKKVGNQSLHIVIANQLQSYSKNLPCAAGSKIYVAGWLYIKIPISDAGKKYLSLVDYNTTNTNPIIPSWDNTLVDQWQRKSVVKTSTGSGVSVRVGRVGADTGEYYVDGVLVINLTAMFGAGYEPSADQMDLMLAFATPNMYFDTSATINKAVALMVNKLWADNLVTQTALPTIPYNSAIDPACAAHESTGDYLTIADTAAGIYAIYDALVTAYPDYVARTHLGDEYTALPIYKYTFAPPVPFSNEGYPNSALPSMFLTSGTHGERAAARQLARFFTDLCEDWQASEVLSALRWNTRFEVIPVVNPYAYNAGQRKNSRGVDINRNFPVGWASSDPASENYSGESALSELESQYAYNAFNGVQHLFGVDFHNALIYATDNEVAHVITMNTETKTKAFLTQYCAFGNRKVKSDLSFVSQDNDSLFGTNYSLSAVGYLYGSFGFPGLLHESIYSWGGESGTDADLQKYMSEMIGVLLYAALKYFQ